MQAESRKTAPVRTIGAVSAGLCAALALAGAAAAQADAELVAMINSHRAEPRTCQGKRVAAAAPLAPAAALTGVRIEPGTGLQDVLKGRGYAAAQAQAIQLSGPTSAGAAMALLRERYCEPLANARLAEIGVSRQADTWTIVLAQPLLAPDLAAPEQAGAEILRLANAARAAPRTCGGKPLRAAAPLAWNPALTAASLAHSRDMASRNYFRHRGDDGSQVADRATRAGYVWKRVGENIAAGQGSPEAAISAWLASPPHCENLMNPAFTEMGAAYALNADSDKVIYWTQVFGTPR